MKREPGISDPQWQAALKKRARQAQHDMAVEDAKRGFVTLKQLKRAARHWYGTASDSKMHMAEMRIAQGELPDMPLSLWLAGVGGQDA